MSEPLSEATSTVPSRGRRSHARDRPDLHSSSRTPTMSPGPVAHSPACAGCGFAITSGSLAGPLVKQVDERDHPRSRTPRPQAPARLAYVVSPGPSPSPTPGHGSRHGEHVRSTTVDDLHTPRAGGALATETHRRGLGCSKRMTEMPTSAELARPFRRIWQTGGPMASSCRRRLEVSTRELRQCSRVKSPKLHQNLADKHRHGVSGRRFPPQPR